MLRVKPFPFQPVAAEDPDGLVHFSNFVTASFVGNVDTVVLAGKAHDNIAHPDEGYGNAPAEDEIEYGHKHQRGQGKHDLGDRPVEITSAFGLVNGCLRSGCNGLPQRLDGAHQTRMQLIIFIAKQELLRIVLAARSIETDGLTLHLVQCIGTLAYIHKCAGLLRGNTVGGQFRQGVLEAVFLIFIDVKFCEVLLIAAHDVKTRLLGTLIRNDRQFLSEIVEIKVSLDRHPLLGGGSGRQNERRCRYCREHEGYGISQVRDGAESHDGRRLLAARCDNRMRRVQFQCLLILSHLVKREVNAPVTSARCQRERNRGNFEIKGRPLSHFEQPPAYQKLLSEIDSRLRVGELR
ncbi:hypothetical protein BN949_03344 [Agrobacterium tumefaciens]|nr:hypothetical protein BN949_03344 [Agrobacterium tumefaciens]